MSKIIKCKNCGSDIDSNAKYCLKCGVYNKKPISMKYIVGAAGVIFVFLVLIFVVFISTISSSSYKTNNTKDTMTNTSQSSNKQEIKEEVKDIYSVGDEVLLNNNKLVINSVEKTKGSEWDKPKDKYEFVIVDVTISNNGDKEISYNPYDFEMQNSQGQVTNMTFTTINNDTALHDGKLISGGTVTGTIAFEQPLNDTGLILKYKANMFSDKEVKIKIG